jgi:hypothetical protein
MNGTGVFARLAIGLNDWSQRWVPGAFTIAWILTLIVFALGVTIGGAGPFEAVGYWARRVARVRIREVIRVTSPNARSLVFS